MAGAGSSIAACIIGELPSLNFKSALIRGRMALRAKHRAQFATWLFQLAQGFSLCYYGFGSKQALLRVSPLPLCVIFTHSLSSAPRLWIRLEPLDQHVAPRHAHPWLRTRWLCIASFSQSNTTNQPASARLCPLDHEPAGVCGGLPGPWRSGGRPGAAARRHSAPGVTVSSPGCTSCCIIVINASLHASLKRTSAQLPGHRLCCAPGAGAGCSTAAA